MAFRKAVLATVAASALAVSLTCAAEAGVIVTASIGGAATGSVDDNLDSLVVGGSSPQTSATGIVVTFENGGGVVQNSQGGVYAAPYLSGANGAGFGSPDQPNGTDTTPYLTAGGTSNSYALLNFSGTAVPELHSVGLLWGSVDSYNTLELLQNGTLVGTITGSDVTASPDGNQGAMGTDYANISSTDEFNQVEVLSSSYAFEFDDISYSANQLPVPEPSSLPVLLAGLGLIGGAFYFGRKRAVAA